MQVQDDPFRVAAPWCAPGEIEPEPISPFEATRVIIDAIKSDEYAYGRSPAELRDWLWDAIINDESAALQAIERCKDLQVIEHACELIANDFGG